MKTPIPLLFVMFIVLSACKKENHGTGVLENGIWVEATHGKDTIIFKSFDDSENTWLILNRGREMRNGHSVPKAGSGIYEYKLAGQQIGLYNTVSSAYFFNDYPFKHLGTKIQIGDFYEGTEELKTFIQTQP